MLLIVMIFTMSACGGKAKNKEDDGPFRLEAVTAADMTVYHRESGFRFEVRPVNAEGMVTYTWTVSYPGSSGEWVSEKVYGTGSSLYSSPYIDADTCKRKMTMPATDEHEAVTYNVPLLQTMPDPGCDMSFICEANDGHTSFELEFSLKLVTDPSLDPDFDENTSFHFVTGTQDEVTAEKYLQPEYIIVKPRNASGTVTVNWFKCFDDGSYLPIPVGKGEKFAIPRSPDGEDELICVATDGTSFWSKRFHIVYDDVISDPERFCRAYSGTYKDIRSGSTVKLWAKEGKAYFRFTGLNRDGKNVQFEGAVEKWEAGSTSAKAVIKADIYAGTGNDRFEFTIYESEEDYYGVKIVPGDLDSKGYYLDGESDYYFKK